MTPADTLLTQIKEDREIRAKATPGDWDDHDNHGTRYVSNGKDGKFAKFDNRICEASFNLHHPPVVENMKFIAHAANTWERKNRQLEIAIAALGDECSCLDMNDPMYVSRYGVRKCPSCKALEEMEAVK